MKLKTLLVATALASAFVTASSPALAQAAPEVARARALLEAGKAEEALNLLEPLEAKLAGDLEYDYMLGIAALNSNQPSKATFIFERVIAMAPGFPSVRADMGRAYYMLGDYARAKIEFETLLTFQNLPPDLKGTAEKYMSALQGGPVGEVRALTSYFEVGFGRDSNANTATHINPIKLGSSPFTLQLDPENLARKDNYNALNAGLDYNTSLAEGFSLYAGADYRGRFYRQMDTSDYGLLDGRAGIGYSSGDSLIRAGLVGGYYAGDNKLARNNLGVTTDWRYALDSANQLSLGGSAIQYRFVQPGAGSNDYASYTVNAGWFGALGTQSGVGITLTAGYEKANGEDGGRLDGNKDIYGLRGFYQTTFGNDIGGFVSVGAQEGKYDRFNQIYGDVRRDTTYDATIGGSIGLGQRWTLRPIVTHILNRSTLDPYTYRKTDVSVSLRKDF